MHFGYAVVQSRAEAQLRRFSDSRFVPLYDQPPFDDESVCLEFLRRLNEMPGMSISFAKITKRPIASLGLLKEDAVIEQFLETLEWISEEIRAS